MGEPMRLRSSAAGVALASEDGALNGVLLTGGAIRTGRRDGGSLSGESARTANAG